MYIDESKEIIPPDDIAYVPEEETGRVEPPPLSQPPKKSVFKGIVVGFFSVVISVLLLAVCMVIILQVNTRVSLDRDAINEAVAGMDLLDMPIGELLSDKDSDYTLLAYMKEQTESLGLTESEIEGIWSRGDMDGTIAGILSQYIDYMIVGDYPDVLTSSETDRVKQALSKAVLKELEDKPIRVDSEELEKMLDSGVENMKNLVNEFGNAEVFRQAKYTRVVFSWFAIIGMLLLAVLLAMLLLRCRRRFVSWGIYMGSISLITGLLCTTTGIIGIISNMFIRWFSALEKYILGDLMRIYMENLLKIGLAATAVGAVIALVFGMVSAIQKRRGKAV